MDPKSNILEHKQFIAQISPWWVHFTRDKCFVLIKKIHSLIFVVVCWNSFYQEATVSVVDSHWFQCGSGSSILGLRGSGSRYSSGVPGFDDQTLQNFTAGKRSYLFDQNCCLFIPRPSIEDVQSRKWEAFNPQNRTSSTSKHEISLLYFCGSFLPCWIRIQLTKINASPRWSGSPILRQLEKDSKCKRTYFVIGLDSKSHLVREAPWLAKNPGSYSSRNLSRLDLSLSQLPSPPCRNQIRDEYMFTPCMTGSS